MSVFSRLLWHERRTQAAYLEGSLEYALHNVPRPGKLTKYTTDAEARVAALTCFTHSAGAKHWTLITRERVTPAEIDAIPTSDASFDFSLIRTRTRN